MAVFCFRQESLAAVAIVAADLFRFLFSPLSHSISCFLFGFASLIYFSLALYCHGWLFLFLLLFIENYIFYPSIATHDAACTSTCVCVCVLLGFMHTCICVYREAKGQPWVTFLRFHQFWDRLSLVWDLPSRLGWTARGPRYPPVSNSLVLA